MPPRKTLWALDDHSRGKHLVLRHYIKSWLPILGTTQPRILIVDGFAGPGSYTDGEVGSPVIVLDELMNHTALERFNEVKLAFVEERSDRVEALKALIQERYPQDQPEKVEVMVQHGSFAQVIDQIRGHLDANSAQLAPAFVMLDPFGVKGVRYADVAWLLQQPKCEIYLSFMGSWVARFHEAPEFEPHLDQFFGDNGWRTLRSVEDWDTRRSAFLVLVESRLRDAGAKHVVRFDLWSGNAYKYSIYFAGKHPVGCDRMKEAIWKAMPNGSYSYVGDQGTQLTIGFQDVSPEALDDELLTLLDSGAWTNVAVLNAHLQGDASRFHSGQLKVALKRLESAGKIEADPSSRNRRLTYPLGTMLRLNG